MGYHRPSAPNPMPEVPKLEDSLDLPFKVASGPKGGALRASQGFYVPEGSASCP